MTLAHKHVASLCYMNLRTTLLMSIIVTIIQLLTHILLFTSKSNICVIPWTLISLMNGRNWCWSDDFNDDHCCLLPTLSFRATWWRQRSKVSHWQIYIGNAIMPEALSSATTYLYLKVLFPPENWNWLPK